MPLRFAVIAFVSINLFSNSAPARVVQNFSGGYRLTIPEDWQDIPQALLDPIQKDMDRQSPQHDARVLAGYQPAAHGDKLLYPFALVQSIGYPDHSLHPQRTETEMKRLVANLSGANLDNVEATNKLPLTWKPGASGSYQLDPLGFQYSSVVTFAGTDYRTLRVGRMETDQILQLCLLDNASDWGQLAPTAQAMADSFVIDPARAATVKSGSFWNSPVFLWTLLAVIVAVCAYLTVRLKTAAAEAK